MERNYLRSGVLMELDFLTEPTIQTHSHEDFELLFVVGGTVNLRLDDATWKLSSGDVVVINAGRAHSYRGEEGLVLARFLISRSRVCELLGMSHVVFWCNSSADRNEAYSELRRVIVAILNQSVGANEHNTLFLASMHYRLLHILAENFTLSPNDRRFVSQDESRGDRMQEILSFLTTNYRQPISLGDLARHVHLSPTYLSKYLKQNNETTFLELLNSIRLSHAVEALAYSDETITKIALDNGFSSVGAFNKVFKDAHGQTPSEFRRHHRDDEVQHETKGELTQAAIRMRLEEYLERNPEDADHPEQAQVLHEDTDLASTTQGICDHSALVLVNAGTAADLLSATLQQQLLDAHETLSFTYVRLWDIYSPKLYLDIHSVDGRQNYNRLDACTDFLVQNHLKPYIELGFKTRRVVSTTSKVIDGNEHTDLFRDKAEMERFFGELFRHFIDRYGSFEVKDWFFEYWERPGVGQARSGTLQYAQLDADQHRRYFKEFDVIASALKAQLPQGKIGGAGFPARVYGVTKLTEILSLWTQAAQQPDFITLSCFPYQQREEGGAYYETRSTDLGFVRYGIELARAALERSGMGEIPIHVTEYSLSLSSRNPLNDSCLKAAFLVHNAIDCMGSVEMMGHFVFSDLFSEGRDTGEVLFGGSGYLTKDGIPKPSYHAMDFLGMLYSSIQLKTRNLLVTRNPRGSLRLVCHNLKKPNFNYYLTEEDALGIRDLPSILCDRDPLTLRLTVRSLPSGIYMVKTAVVNSQNGSIQDKWLGMNLESDLTEREVDFLKRMSVSGITIERHEVTDGTLELEWRMEPNEIRYAHIYRRY